MNHNKIITILVFWIAIIAAVASCTGIFSKGGPGEYDYVSIRGKQVHIYGTGLYKDMSADVAIQGKAQDYVTLYIAIPLLVTALFFSRKKSLKWRFILAGVLNYFLVTYLMYLAIAMYNAMFLAYVILTGSSFFAFAIVLMSFDLKTLHLHFSVSTRVKLAGGFLIFNSIIIGLLWLSIVVPPLIDGTIIPDSVQHYSTLIVQGLDLSIFLPVSFVSGYLMLKRKPMGYLLATITLVFLSLLMTALMAKIIAMALSGVNVIPAVFIIPIILIASVFFSRMLIKNIQS